MPVQEATLMLCGRKQRGASERAGHRQDGLEEGPIDVRHIHKVPVCDECVETCSILS